MISFNAPFLEGITQSMMRYMSDQDIAFRQFFEQSYPKVKSYLLRVLDNPSHLDDISQEVYINIWHNWQKLDHSCSLDAYLFTSIRHSIISHFRKNSKLKTVSLALTSTDLPDASSASAPLLYKEYLSVLEQSMRTLQAVKQRCFNLHWNDGLTYREIAEIEGISAKTVERHIKEVKNLLRGRLDIGALYVILLLKEITT